MPVIAVKILSCRGVHCASAQIAIYVKQLPTANGHPYKRVSTLGSVLSVCHCEELATKQSHKILLSKRSLRFARDDTKLCIAVIYRTAEHYRQVVDFSYLLLI